jgi:hypothetical protein
MSLPPTFTPAYTVSNTHQDRYASGIHHLYGEYQHSQIDVDEYTSSNQYTKTDADKDTPSTSHQYTSSDASSANTLSIIKPPAGP